MRTLARLALCVPVVLFALRARADEEEAVKVYRTVSPAVVALANAEGSGTGKPQIEEVSGESREALRPLSTWPRAASVTAITMPTATRADERV